MGLKSKPSNGTATTKKGSISKGAGKSFKTKVVTKGNSRSGIPAGRDLPSQGDSDNPYGGKK